MTLVEQLHPVSESVKVSRNLRAQATLKGPIIIGSTDIPGSAYVVTLNLVNRRGKVLASKIRPEDPDDFIFGSRQIDPDVVKSDGRKFLREVHPVKKPATTHP